MKTVVGKTQKQGSTGRDTVAWPDVSDTLAGVDDDAFIRAIEAGRRRELTPSR